MARERLPDTHQTGQRRRSPAPSPARGLLPPQEPLRQSPTDLLLTTWPGRLFIIAAALKAFVALWRVFGELPGPIHVLSGAASIGLAIAVGVFAWRLFVLMKRRLLWRVRRKLILSYIFIGVVPSLLIIVFFLFCSAVLFMGVAAYLFKSGYDKVVDDVKVVAQAAALEISRNAATAQQTVERVHRIRSRQYPALSVVYIAPDGTTYRAGPWEHTPAPTVAPQWLKEDLFAGTLALPIAGTPDHAELVVRSAAKAGFGGKAGIVVVDVPIDDQMIQYLHDQTAVRAGTVTTEEQAKSSVAQRDTAASTSQSATSSATLLWTKSVTQLDYRDWNSGATHRATLAISYRLGDLYKQLASAQAFVLNGMLFADVILVVVVVIAILFLIIEAVALLMGLALAKSITSSVHELFMGTERVRQGDFTHRINIRSRDQLGELADSFNQMTGSIENLLQTAAEKKRLEEELRIARQIQMSLLPRGSLDFPGIGVTALCVPAREVGGDYYDFFPLGEDRLGVLIADVSGKGTSAALYMAELKGLVLSLSQIYQSPRQLLMEVNRIISENLDTRSFITMTYAVIDLAAGVMTFARAGHTPLIYLSGGASNPEVQVLAPSGIVVGLRIPGATEKFAELLEEDRVGLHSGDVLVLYTDGITEAMNAQSDLFGEGRLGRLVAEHGHLESGELRERILREIEVFVGNADQHDDMTMILIKVERSRASEAKVAV
jgi:sigma-B regulation protein RsbU (phosphoserine phosphatase)